jgi:hypothetical protein
MDKRPADRCEEMVAAPFKYSALESRAGGSGHDVYTAYPSAVAGEGWDAPRIDAISKSPSEACNRAWENNWFRRTKLDDIP